MFVQTLKTSDMLVQILITSDMLAQTLNFSFGYIDDNLSSNNSPFGDNIHLIYPIELETIDSRVCFLP